VKKVTEKHSGGDMSNEGKLAVLHREGMVLNEKDTENLLKAVELTRSLLKDHKLPKLNSSDTSKELVINFDISTLKGSDQDATDFVKRIMDGIKKDDK
jgi:hypothetical protein